ncbi:hypothetical protein [Polynucleobacter nymphae]|uniref:hypothetical protein n=1 Tax=Polynucleobacter nymphae TaxID=2081043 RepID=UPI001C0B1D7C|nr:hypothetical protein [Polynucleobacter nymphae]MBU3606865.1 hypothetical protein [Polynucleobacter nymphae]
MKKILVTLFFGLWVTSSYGEPFSKPEGKACTTLDGRLEYINKLTSQYYEWLLVKIERIPPETEKYISLEYKESLETKNEVKYNSVTSNKFFFAWQLRNSIQKLIDESKEGYKKQNLYNMGQKNPQESEMIFYINLLAKNSDVAEEFGAYSRFDRNRKPKVLSEEKDFYTFSFYKNGYKIVIDDLIRCSFKK